MEINPTTKYPLYNSPTVRLTTFIRHNIGRTPHIKNPIDLVRHGFFCLCTNDRVQCYECGLVLTNWESKDIIHVEHFRYSPQCSHARKMLEGRCEMLDVLDKLITNQNEHTERLVKLEAQLQIQRKSMKSVYIQKRNSTTLKSKMIPLLESMILYLTQQGEDEIHTDTVTTADNAVSTEQEAKRTTYNNIDHYSGPMTFTSAQLSDYLKKRMNVKTTTAAAEASTVSGSWSTDNDTESDTDDVDVGIDEVDIVIDDDDDDDYDVDNQ